MQNKISSNKTFEQIFELYYTELRSHLLESAAALDRLERYDAQKVRYNDSRMKKIKAAIAILNDDTSSKTERFLEAFSEK